MKRSCAECRFSHPGSNYRECRRLPPPHHKPHSAAADCATWPVVLPESWCGEFEPTLTFEAWWVSEMGHPPQTEPERLAYEIAKKAWDQ